MFRIKICGLTSASDAITAAEAGADAIGLNFFANSPRFIEADRAAEIARSLPGGITKVGLFVNASASHIRETAEQVALDMIQLHGDEPPEFLAELAPWPILRAFRCGPGGLAAVDEYLDRCRQLGCLPQAVLIDGFHAQQYGGTGVLADWDAVARWSPVVPLPVVLAGGLTADNVADAIRRVRPAAIDTASGVERSPGRKDPDLVRRFVSQARLAFAELGDQNP